MAEYRFTQNDLQEIFKTAFGYSAPPFLFSLQNRVEAAMFGSSKSDTEYEFDAQVPRREYNLNGEAFYGRNANGYEVFLPIQLKRADGSLLMLQNTVSDISSQKIIVETSLVNAQGTVKEEISMDDWVINVKGVIVSPDDGYPDEQVAELKELYKESGTLGIVNARTSLLLEGSESVVIKSLKFPEVKGVKCAQVFEMELRSDLQFELIIE